MKNVMLLVGAGQIGMAIARRMGYRAFFPRIHFEHYSGGAAIRRDFHVNQCSRRFSQSGDH